MGEAMSRRRFVRVAAAGAAGVSASLAGLMMLSCSRREITSASPVTGRAEFEGFETLSDWTCDSGEISADTTNVLHGKAGLCVTSTGGVAASATKAVSLSGPHNPFRLWFYVSEDPSTVSSIRAYFSPVADFSAGFGCTFGGGRAGMATVAQGWNCRSIADGVDWSHVGGSWSDAQHYMKVVVETVPGQTAHVTFDSLWRNVTDTPQILIVFDDGRSTEYTNAFHYMRSKGLVGTMYVIPSLVGKPDFVTRDQLVEMQNEGWDIANHTYHHRPLPTLTRAQQQAEFTDAQAWLESNGFTRASRHVAYPLGLYNADTMQAMAAAGMVSGRTTAPIETPLPPVNPYTIAGGGIGGGASLAYGKLRVDDAIHRRSTVLLLFHGILDHPTDRNDWSTADFKALIDYIAAQKVPVLRVSDLFPRPVTLATEQLT